MEDITINGEDGVPLWDQSDPAYEDLTPMDLRDEPEFARYFDRWIKFWPRKPYNVKRGYDGPFYQAKTIKGNPAALHGDWLLSCVERHLSNNRWSEQKVEKEKSQAITALVADGWDEDRAASWLAHETWAGSYSVVDRPFWLGLWQPRKATDHCIDFDAKKHLLTHYRRQGIVEPVVCPDLDHFLTLKRLYDHFPNRVWCISSLTLGVHAWAKHGLRESSVLHSRIKRQLAEIELEAVEVHPMQGRCLRRPFGRDYVTITPEGEITAWQDQVNYYEDDGRTAPFDRIVEAMIRRVEWSVDRYYRADERLRHWRALSPIRPRLDAVRSWRDAGFKERVLLPAASSSPAQVQESIGPARADRAQPKASEPPRAEPVASTAGEESASDGGGNESSSTEPSSRASGTFVPEQRGGKWPRWIEAMAKHGLVAEDTVGEVVFELAKWLYWVELYEVPSAERKGRVQALLEGYVLAKHNGHVTRILNGQSGLVLSQVRSAVNSASRIQRPESLELFARLRQHRERGDYRRIIVIAPVLEGANPEEAISRPPALPSLTTLCFSIKDAPLHDEIEAILSRIVRDSKMRRSGEEYPLVRFARRFLHALWANQGAARLDTEALKGMSGVNSPKVQNNYKRLLRDAGLIEDWENDYLKASSAILDAPADRLPSRRMVEKHKIGIAPLLYRLSEASEQAFCRAYEATRRAGEG